MEPYELAVTLARALDSKKGQDIKLLKIDHVSSLADYFLICTGTSNTHVKTLCDFAEYTLEQLGETMLSREGHRGNSWELLDYKQVMELYDRAAENHTLPENFTMTYGDMRSKYSMFAEVELPAYLDPVANTARFDSPEFIHYLKESKRIPTQLPAGQTNSMTGRGVVEMFSESIREEGDTSLLLYSTVGMGEVGELMEEYDNVAGPYFLKSTQGNIPFLPLDILLVPKTCSDPELAWDFIKFCIAPVETPAMAYVWEPEGGIDMTPLTNVPMAKQNLEQWGQLYEKMYLTESERNVDFDAMEDPLPAEVFQRFDQVLSQCSGQQDLPFGLNVNVLDLLWQYYDTDTLSAEDCARQIQERAEIWLQE